MEFFGYEYFYDDTVTDKTIVLHDIVDTRLFTWIDVEEQTDKENW